MDAPSHKLVLISSPRRILVRSLKRSLATAGLRGVRAGASLEGALEEVRPSAILLDAVEEPSEALSRYMAIRATVPADAEILLLVAQGDTLTVEKAVALGISHIAEEPCTPGVLALQVGGLACKAASPGGGGERRVGDPGNRDGLTGLASRPSFLETMDTVIEAARRGRHLAALLYLDIDRFKAVNDALGHGAGDALLQHVARILESQVRASDVVANEGVHGSGVSRIGGDEFTVLLSKVSRAEDAGDVARRILQAMKTPVLAHGYQVAATASIGIAIFPDDGGDAEALLRSADMAMYAAKSLGRGRCLRYRRSMGELHDRRLEVERHLRYAIERDELEVRYQPRVDLDNDLVCGVEALLRWHSRDLGDVQPREFVPIAEECGLIVPIGEWVLAAACDQVARWHQSGLPGLRLSVNVSSRQFSSSDVLRTVTDVLKRTRLDPHHLELEVTERLMLGGEEHTALALRDLRGIGVTLALDDFGTGYSSLSSITRYPLDVLKVDRSIAAEVEVDPAAASIVSAVVTLGKSLGVGIVAEGVDSLGQARELVRLGCDEIQGFLVSPALGPDALLRFIREWQGVEACRDYGAGSADEGV